MSLSRYRDPSIVVMGEQGSLGSKVAVEMRDESAGRVAEGFGVANPIHHDDKDMFRLVPRTIIPDWDVRGKGGGGSVMVLDSASNNNEEQRQRNNEQKKSSSPKP